MKARKLLVIILLAIVVIVLIAGGSKKEELYGTWINMEYKGVSEPHEIHVLNPDGTMVFYRTEKAVWETDLEVEEGEWIKMSSWTYTIDEEWTDSDGNVWYKVKATTGIPPSLHLLMKVSDSNRVLEYMAGRINYHEDIDYTVTNPYIRRIYYRQ